MDLRIPIKKVPEQLFHYCPSEAFFGIIKSQKLWLSSSNYSHDPNENKIVKQILSKRMESEKGEFKDFIGKIIENYNMYEESIPPFIFCFSEEKDDLFQWRYYANDGKGFMIGFKTKYLPVHSIWNYILSKPDANSPKFDDFFIGNVIYETLEQENFINRMFDMTKLAFNLNYS